MKCQNKETSPIATSLRYGFRTAVISIALLAAGCGGGGGSSPAAVNSVASTPPTVQSPAAANAFAVTGDDYGMQSATYLSSSKSDLGIILRVAIASSLTDTSYKTLSRLDILPGAAISTGTSYSLAAAAPQAFPGELLFPNGHGSTQLRTVDGSISFSAFGSSPGARIAGSYSAIVEDGGDSASPKARYTIAASFDFVTGSDGPVVPAQGSTALAAAASYDANCASCHALGSHDTTAAGAGDLALKGGQLNAQFASIQPGHQGINLAAGELSALKVLLNSY
jgi:mono/diheme cytochrome c family protein